MKRLLSRMFPHLTIILSLMTLTFFCIDRVNPIMAFMTSELSKWVFAILAVSAIVTSVLLIARQWRSDLKKAKRLHTEHAEHVGHIEHVEREAEAKDEPAAD